MADCRVFSNGTVNVELEREVWQRAFTSVLRVDPKDVGLVLTQPLFQLPSITEATQQVCASAVDCRHADHVGARHQLTCMSLCTVYGIATCLYMGGEARHTGA